MKFEYSQSAEGFIPALQTTTISLQQKNDIT